MGFAIYETQPVFRAAIDRCAELLGPHLDRPLLSLLDPQAGPILDQTGYTQPVMFALEYALATLWRSWGVEPAAVLGHSVGEFAAACVAGVFSLEDGIRLIAQRARLMQVAAARRVHGRGVRRRSRRSPRRLSRTVTKSPSPHSTGRRASSFPEMLRPSPKSLARLETGVSSRNGWPPRTPFIRSEWIRCWTPCGKPPLR